MNYCYLVFLVIIGLSIGSFINAAVYRLKSKQRGLLFGRSICPSCKKILGVRDLVPLLSYLFLKGKCRYCKSKIGGHYFWVELITALAFLGIGLTAQFENIPFLLWQLLFTAVFIFLASYDFQFGEIPDEISLPATIVAFASSFFTLTQTPLQSLIGLMVGAVFFFCLVWFSKGKWMGGGDIRLGALLGALLGWQGFLIALLFASALGSVIGILQILFTQKKLKSPVPFGPYLALGGYLTLIFGEQIWSWYFQNLTSI